MKPHTEKSRSGFECGVNHLRKSTEAVYETTEPFSPIGRVTNNDDDDNVDICQIIYLEQTLIILK